MSPGPQPDPAHHALSEPLARRVQREHPELSFTRAKRAVESGQVTVDGEVVQQPGRRVAPGALVEFDANRKAVARPMRRAVALVHADDDLVVAVKPPGLLTVPTPSKEQDTLLSRVSLELARRSDTRPFVGVVHRLDKETSGLVAFAASKRAHEALQRQFADHSAGRVYEAVVEGDLLRDAGTFDRALAGDGVHRRRWIARPNEEGRAAVTHWEVVRRFGIATLVRVRLETGRTHQIRIHFAAVGHPVVGDRVYRNRERSEFPVDFPRLALHAGELELRHPADGRPLRFRSPRPADFEGLLRKVAGKARSRPVPPRREPVAPRRDGKAPRRESKEPRRGRGRKPKPTQKQKPRTRTRPRPKPRRER